MDPKATQLTTFQGGRPSQQAASNQPRNSQLIESYQRLKGEVENKNAAERQRKTSKLEAGKDYKPRPPKQSSIILLIQTPYQPKITKKPDKLRLINRPIICKRWMNIVFLLNNFAIDLEQVLKRVLLQKLH